MHEESLQMTQREARSLAQIISTVLLTDWDPIGIRDFAKAADEYDAYVAPISRMLANNRPATEIADYLMAVERDSMGLSPDADRARRVAAKLLEPGE